MDLMEKARRCRDFIDALDEERRKIQLFQRELPLCLHIVNQTIDSYKRMVDAVAPPADEPELKEFICSRAPAINVSDEENHEVGKRKGEDELVSFEPGDIPNIREKHSSSSTPDQDQAPEKKWDWMASTRIWSLPETEEPVAKIDHSPREQIATKDKTNCGVDEVEHSDKERDTDAAAVVADALASSNDGNISGEGEENCGSDTEHFQKNENSCNSNKRKARRLWSEELHKRFIDAIRQLGGCHAATPKQIRQLMKDDGLTNDEIKSHLQKFRIHTRSSSPAAQSSNSNAQTAHVVLVGGIWIPPHVYAAAQTGATTAMTTAAYPSEATTTDSSSGIYTPMVSFTRPR